jgi:hypothetical protein
MRGARRREIDMSDQANSDERGHGRRAVMLGAAAVGAGAVAGLAGTAGTAMASTQQSSPKGAVSPSHSIVVRLPGSPFSIDQAFKIVGTVLGQAGCGGCFSGWDISFVHETEFIVNVDGAVQPEI